MAAAFAEEDLARTMSRTMTRRPTMRSGSRRNWMASASLASASIREAWNSQTNVFTQSQRQDDEEELRWAAIERLPTYDRLRKGMLTQVLENGKIVHDEVDVTRFAMEDKKKLMDSILKLIEVDNEKFLNRLRNRTDR